MTVAGLITSPVVPRSMPERRHQRRQRGRDDEADEHAEDRRDAAPTANVSISTERRICARDAPSTRSSANSFVRWATVTVNVLKIRKPPTSSATPANTSSAMRMKPSASERSCACCSAASSPVRTLKSLPELLLRARP